MHAFPSREDAARFLLAQGFVCVSTNGREWRTEAGATARIIKHAPTEWRIEFHV